MREIAQAKKNESELGLVRRVLLTANLVQGTLALLAIWLFREPLARALFGRPDHDIEVGLIGVAVLLALVSSSQTALLRGMRLVGSLGRVTVLGSLVGTIGGIFAIWQFGSRGLLWFVLLQPLTAVTVAVWYVRKLPSVKDATGSVSDGWRVWKRMASLGFVFMLGGLATTGTLLIVRGGIARELGLEAAGQFAAAWGITVTYVGFLLNAMAMDYYPRLAEIAHDRPASAHLMNEQMQISLLLAGPILFLLIGFAPLAVSVLYTKEFFLAVILVQWQAVGNMLKIASWALSFSVVAAGRSKLYLLMELGFLLPYAGLIYIFLPRLGLVVAGIAFLASYAVYFTVTLRLAGKVTDFRMSRLSLRLLAAYSTVAVGLLVLSLSLPIAGGAASGLAATAGALAGGRILLGKIGPHPYASQVARVYAKCGWPIRSYHG
ncbi:O-antigen translocase [Altererythrobacter sp. B11]|nr:O-antigen translocase [Altererythrobacter sp. B11]